MKKNGHASFLTQCFVLTKRSSVNMYRDLGYYWLRLVIYVVLSLGLGTIYHDVGSSYNTIQVREKREKRERERECKNLGCKK